METKQRGFRQRYTCGSHVSGHGRQITSHLGKIFPPGKDSVIEMGVIITMRGKQGDPYTVLDEQSFIVLEAQEEQLAQLS